MGDMGKNNSIVSHLFFKTVMAWHNTQALFDLPSLQQPEVIKHMQRDTETFQDGNDNLSFCYMHTDLLLFSFFWYSYRSPLQLSSKVSYLYKEILSAILGVTKFLYISNWLLTGENSRLEKRTNIYWIPTTCKALYKL